MSVVVTPEARARYDAEKATRHARRAAREAAWRFRPLRVSARLGSPLCGEPPHLDAILENAVGPWHPAGHGDSRVDVSAPPPPPGSVPIPLARRDVAGWPIALASSPILPAPGADGVEHLTRRINVGAADLLAPTARVAINTSATWTKAYRLPHRVRAVAFVRWFAVGDQRSVVELLGRIPSLGEKRSAGYGRVLAWDVLPVAEDWSWFAPAGGAEILMRPLPAGVDAPREVAGWRPDYAACCPPYWHPGRYTEVITPC